MPSCIVNGCLSRTGHKYQDKEIIMHPFPKNIERIKQWLLQTGIDISDGMAAMIMEGKKSDKYRMCSLHFSEDCYSFLRNCMEANFLFLHKQILPCKIVQSLKKKKATLEDVVLEEEEISGDELMPGIRPLSTIEGSTDCLDMTDQSNLVPDDLSKKNDLDYAPQTSLDESDFIGFAHLIYGQNIPTAPALEPQSELQQVQDRKFIIFESCLDNLLYKVKCQHSSGCNYLVKKLFKKFEGSSCRITGMCYTGQHFLIVQTQPKIGRHQSGNILLAASILFSGLNFQKVNEFFNIFGTCENNVKDLEERWLSLLQHICNQHTWEGELYNQCSYGPLDEADTDQPVLWLNKEGASFLSIQKIISNVGKQKRMHSVNFTLDT
ncbi:uncharacterized protein [Engystomops pustulosus]|uniref:uncharacterized protein n=1 Tax=Engystomops pustulosus TaxID=76066 RepID=UPI003AFB43C1